MALTPTTPQTPEEILAARNAAQQEVLLREVDEAVRQDETAQFAKKYGKTFGGGLVLGLAAFAGFLFWQDRQEAKLEEGSEAFISALDELDAGNVEVADRELAAIASNGAPSAEAGAIMLQAGIAIEKGESERGVKMLLALADDGEAPQIYRDLAMVRAVSANYANMKPQEVIDHLKPLATPGNPWFGSAGELVAMAYLQQNKKDLAGPLFAAIAKDDNAPQTLRNRSRQMAELLGFDAVEDVDSTIAAQREGGDAAEATE